MSQVRIQATPGRSTCSIEGCNAKYYDAGFCKNHHQWHWKRGLLPQPTMASIGEKLKSNIRVDDAGCWIWQAGVNNKGYGRVALAGRSSYAHRASYEFFVGPIPDGMEACHRCDVPRCINPDHLFLGTHADNMRDASQKRRMSAPRESLRGYSHFKAALGPEDVAFIRASSLDAKSLAKQIGCHPQTVRNCRNGKTYR